MDVIFQTPQWVAPLQPPPPPPPNKKHSELYPVSTADLYHSPDPLARMHAPLSPKSGSAPDSERFRFQQYRLGYSSTRRLQEQQIENREQARRSDFN